MARRIASFLALAAAPGLAQVPPQDRPGQLVLLTDAAKTGAVCLDGSPAAYYLRRGSASTKWLIHHQGGGWCTEIQGCFDRSQTQLGSSLSYPQEAPLTGIYYSEDPAKNPLMHDWNVAFLRYCDGGSFTGNNATSTVYGGKELFFRGKAVLNAMQQDLLAKGLKDATEVVISGCSAGGLATYLHVDQWAELLRAGRADPPQVVGMPDSGFFLDLEGPRKYHSGLIWVFNQFNSTSGVHQDCIQAHLATGDTWKCMFAEYASPHVKTRIFSLQSTFDTWQIPNLLGNNDTDQVNAYGDRVVSTLQAASLATSSENGAFVDACSHHCGGWDDMYVGGRSQAQAFMDWYLKGSAQLENHGYFRQTQAYPCTDCCLPPSSPVSAQPAFVV